MKKSGWGIAAEDNLKPQTLAQGFALTRRPDLFIVGAPKCATTSLQRYLQAHPEVFMSTPKEPQFFASDRLVGAGMRYPDDLDAYLSLFAEAGDAKRVGEASTVYLESSQAATRIAQFQPDARIVIMIRDPVDMIHSLYEMRVRHGIEPKATFEEALADERTRPGFGMVGDQSSVHYRDRARYGAMIPAWFETFGRDSVHVIVTEDLGREPRKTYRRVLEFLDVDTSHEPVFERANSGQTVRSVRLARVLAQAPRRRVRRSALDALTIPALRILRQANKVPGTREPMSEELRLRLQEEFADDVAHVSELLGRDLAALWWGNPA